MSFFLQLSNSSLYKYITSFSSINLSVDIQIAFIFWVLQIVLQLTLRVHFKLWFSLDMCPGWDCSFILQCYFQFFKEHPYCFLGFPGGASGKEPACQCRRHKKHGFNPWVRKVPWRRATTPVFLPAESHGQRRLGGYSPWGLKELDLTEATQHTAYSSP